MLSRCSPGHKYSTHIDYTIYGDVCRMWNGSIDGRMLHLPIQFPPRINQTFLDCDWCLIIIGYCMFDVAETVCRVLAKGLMDLWHHSLSAISR